MAVLMRGLLMLSKPFVLSLLFAASAAGLLQNLPETKSPPTTQPMAAPGAALVNTCLITSDVQRLVTFYENVLGSKAKWSGPDYAEFPTGAGTLAIFSAKAQEAYIPGAAVAGENRSVILEFRVQDPDTEYRRLAGIVKTWVKPPSTQPWGTRSVYLRDPDGNLVDLFRPAAGR
jgi:catechol 2,3-dioxygenase-like lactoylglutathione lyase family enzyme